ncbi:adenylate/guanylate cyclase domain-containing protein [Leptonema illini]|uniref:Adenylate/guanylate cyclase n=1 Tax=Leptonema illini DSM 21528 TaxID=929563 RepID=H2CDK6_9LEPT|nr:adenylate/guanylate cyclase domain-containing protein [Leptonema illini]EHQ06539.1 adenylate/guanylate cyclase [Leptonema illini DSM 21528]
MRYLLLFLFLPSALLAAPTAVQGKLDLHAWDLNDPVQLFGQWDFYANEFLSPDSLKEAPPAAHYIDVPSFWNGYDYDGRILDGHGYATYRLQVSGDFAGKPMGLHIADMQSAYELYVDGQLIASAGKPGTSAETAIARWAPQVAYFQPATNTIDLVLHISNYEHRQGGTWAYFTFGSAKAIAYERDLSVAFDLFLAGSLLIMAFYHLGLFALRNEDRSALYFGLFCLITTLRILVSGERVLTTFLPEMSFAIQLRIEYLSMALGLPLFTAYIRNLYPDTAKWQYFIVTDVIAGVAAAIILFLPTDIFNHTSVPLQLTIMAVSIIIFTVMIQTIRKGRDGAIPAVAGMVFLLFCLINDIAYVHGYIQSINLYPFGLFVFIFSQSFNLSLIFSRAFRSVERLSTDLALTNDSYSRFVPREFLRHLNKQDIREIELGDQVEGDMTVLFSDIRSFTSRSEKMTPQECFQFLNDYLGRVSPVVRSYGGFIDKFIGDAIMPIFPDSPNNAVRAAIEMQKEVARMNERGTEPLQIGIGIHTGRLALGTIGERDRMEGTVISDAVNLASRLQDLTKKLQSPIILSETTYNQISHREGMRYLGSVRVKGKSELTRIYAVDLDLPVTAADQNARL